jgi:hypothetical protein
MTGFDSKREMAADKQEPAQDYAAKNPLGGPAKIFDAMAACIRAGDSFDAVLRQYGFAEAQPAIDPVHEYRKGFIAGQIDMRDRPEEQPAQEPVNQRAHETALRQGEHWKTYARELQKRLVKYEGGAPMVLNSTPQPAQEPVATLEDLEQEIYENTREFVPRNVMEWMLKRYYTAPPQRPWVGLTIYEMDDAFDESMKVRPKEASNAETRRLLAQVIEAKLKEKNT